MASIVGRSPFSDSDAEEVAKSFKKATKGFGTDEKRIIKEIIGLTNQQRQLVKSKYSTMYGSSLEDDLKKELSGNFEDVVVALLTPKYIYEAECLRNAIDGVGTKEELVIEIICTKEGPEINKLKEAYHSKFQRDLAKDINGEVNGDVEKVWLSLISGGRPASSGVDAGLAATEANELYKAGEGKTFGTDEGELIRILCSRSFVQLKATFQEYQKLKGKDIENSIKSETSGEFEDSLVAIIQCARNAPEYFAKKLYATMKGTGTKDQNLMRIVILRSEIDMVLIRQEYKRLYNRSLTADIKGELSGDYEDIILKLLGKAE